MADEFNAFLREALAPPPGDEDHLFVARVHGAVRLEEQLRAERSGIVRSLLLQLLALAAVAAALLLVGRAPAGAALAGESPWMVALILVAGFSLLLVLMTARVRSVGQVEIISAS